MTGRLMYSRGHKVRALQRQPVTEAVPVTLPITPDAVMAIASEGFPFKESIPTLELRNRRISVAYFDLGQQLTEFIANGTDAHFANWCTFTTWASKTIGATIDPDELPLAIGRLPALARIRRWLAHVFQLATARDHGAIFRALAAGNRFIFLEVGLAAATLLEHLGTSTEHDDDAFERCWADVDSHLARFALLDPSWVVSVAPDPRFLKLALRSYYDARFATDRLVKAELTLAGSIFYGAYEQQRAEGYVATSLAMRGHAAFRRLLTRGTGRVRDPGRGLVNRVFARILTRFALAMVVPEGVLYLGRTLVPPPGQTELFESDAKHLKLPAAQALVSRFDMSDFRRSKRGCRNWAVYAERMHFIVNLVRSRLTDERLLATAPFTPDDTATLLAGRLNRRAANGDELLVAVDGRGTGHSAASEVAGHSGESERVAAGHPPG